VQVGAITDLVSVSGTETSADALTTDELIPLLAHAVAHAAPLHLHSNILYMSVRGRRLS
jgi:hypothetical protein